MGPYAPFDVSHDDDAAVWRLRIDHGKANEMGSTELTSLESLGAALRAEPSSRALISHSTKRSRRGTPIFVAGANVTERVGWSPQQVASHVRWQRDVLYGLRDLPLFHVTVVTGVALGWGTEFLLTADYRIATPEARFALPETGLGIVPGAGGTADLASEIGLPQALRLGMTGEQIDADEALRIGLVQELAESEEAALRRAEALCELVSRRSPTAVAAFKAAARRAVGLPRSERRILEAAAYDVCVQSGEAARGREAFSAIRQGLAVAWGPRQES